MSDNTPSPVGEGAAKLGAPKALVLGLQHMFAMFGATVTVPLITGLDIGTTLLMAGAGTLLFHLITGGRVPAFLGSSFAFLGGYAAIAPKLADEAGEMVANVEMIPYACLGVACSGLVYLVLAAAIKAFGVKRVMRCFPPIVTGPIIIAIGLGLAPVAVGSCKANWTLALIALVVIGICNIWGKGMVRIVPILIGLAVSYVVACFMKVPVLDADGVQVVEDGVAQCKPLIDFAAVKSADWIGFPVRREMTVLGVDFANGTRIWSAIIAIVPIALATIMEHIGDISAISSTVGKDFIKDPGLHRTLTGDGLATTFASLFGGPANTTYGENTGVLALSRVFNPVVVRIAAVFAILLSFCPKFAALIATIPGPIVGGISFVLYGMISAVGIRNLVENHVDFSKSRNLIIAAVILVTALGGVTLPIAIGRFHATLTPLALASLAGIVLNAIFPAGDYAARAADDEPPKGNTFEV
ncbi:MAG: uracil-xanthine permease [Kiritimatiellae bacterium]|nr:uracil-xanthine permease [Kiritimatiellia bacterium]